MIKKQFPRYLWMIICYFLMTAFGYGQPSGTARFHSFNSTLENWHVHFTNSGAVSYLGVTSGNLISISDPGSSYAIALSDLSLTDGNYSKYQQVRYEMMSLSRVTAQPYVTTGSALTWASPNNFILTAGVWTTIYMDLTASGITRNQIRTYGIKFFITGSINTVYINNIYGSSPVMDNTFSANTTPGTEFFVLNYGGVANNTKTYNEPPPGNGLYRIPSTGGDGDGVLGFRILANDSASISYSMNTPGMNFTDIQEVRWSLRASQPVSVQTFGYNGNMVHQGLGAVTTLPGDTVFRTLVWSLDSVPNKTNVNNYGLRFAASTTFNDIQVDYAKWVPYLTISTQSVGLGFVGRSFDTTIQAIGGQSPYSFSLQSGSLPPGIGLSSTGRLSGTSNVLGNYNFTVKVTDSMSHQTTRAYLLPLVSLNSVSFSNVTLLASTVGRYEKFEVQFDLNTTYPNPFDPDQIDIRGYFTAPSGSVYTTFGFWWQDFQVSGGGVNSDEAYSAVGTTKWVVRFAPAEIGKYTFRLEAFETAGYGQTSVIQFATVNSFRKGYLRRHPDNYKYLRFDDGSTYFPIGHNVDWSGRDMHPSLNGITSARFYFSRMSTYKENWDRFWMVPFDKNAIEWTGTNYPGLGKYSLMYAYRMEKILETAGNNGVYVQLVFTNHGQFSNDVNPEWSGNPYSSAYGGPLNSSYPGEFFSNPTAKQYFKKRMRYMVARWGYMPQILAWEFFNEVQWVGATSLNVRNDSATRSAMTSWHIEMAQELKKIDPYKHLVTTSSDDSWAAQSLKDAFAAIWASPNIDLVQSHVYSSDREKDIRDYVTKIMYQFKKPAWAPEFGIGSIDEANFNPSTFTGGSTKRDHLIEGTHLHNGIWTAALCESMAAIWWWDSYMDIDSTKNRNAPQFPLNYHFLPLEKFINTSIDTVKFPLEDWAAYGFQTARLSVTGNIKAVGLSTTNRAYLWFRDINNEYESGYEPGNMVNRTITGATITVNGLTPNALFAVQYYNTYAPGGYLGIRIPVTANSSGQVTLNLPSFQRDLAVKLLKYADIVFVPNWEIWE